MHCRLPTLRRSPAALPPTFARDCPPFIAPTPPAHASHRSDPPLPHVRPSSLFAIAFVCRPHLFSASFFFFCRSLIAVLPFAVWIYCRFAVHLFHSQLLDSHISQFTGAADRHSVGRAAAAGFRPVGSARTGPGPGRRAGITFTGPSGRAFGTGQSGLRPGRAGRHRAGPGPGRPGLAWIRPGQSGRRPHQSPLIIISFQSGRSVFLPQLPPGAGPGRALASGQASGRDLPGSGRAFGVGPGRASGRASAFIWRRARPDFRLAFWAWAFAGPGPGRPRAGPGGGVGPAPARRPGIGHRAGLGTWHRASAWPATGRSASASGHRASACLGRARRRSAPGASGIAGHRAATGHRHLASGQAGVLAPGVQLWHLGRVALWPSLSLHFRSELPFPFARTFALHKRHMALFAAAGRRSVRRSIHRPFQPPTSALHSAFQFARFRRHNAQQRSLLRFAAAAIVYFHSTHSCHSGRFLQRVLIQSFACAVISQSITASFFLSSFTHRIGTSHQVDASLHHCGHIIAITSFNHRSAFIGHQVCNHFVSGISGLALLAFHSTGVIALSGQVNSAIQLINCSTSAFILIAQPPPLLTDHSI